MLDAAAQVTRTRSFTAGVALALLAGAALRLAYAWGRPFTGDEAGSIDALGMTYGELLGNFGGWQTMNFYLAGLKGLADLLGRHPAVLMAPTLIAGALTVPLAGWIGRRLHSPAAGIIAAWLVAVNPFLIRYSATIRSYALLAFFCTAALLAWLRWRERPTWKSGSICALLLAAALLSHLNATYYIAALTVLSGATLLEWRRTAGPKDVALRGATLLVPCLIALGGAAAAYAPQLPGILAFRDLWSAASPTSVGYLAQVYSIYLGDRWAVPVTFILLAAGIYAAIRARETSRLVPLVVVILFIAFMSLAGVSHYAAAFARFSTPLLPLLLMLIAMGILAFRRRPVIIVAVIALSAVTLGDLSGLFAAKAAAPWRQVARHVAGERDLDALVALTGGTARDINCNLPQPIPFTTASELPNLAATHDGPLRIGVIDEQGVLFGAPRSIRFGDVIVFTCSGASAREVAEQLLLDLDRALGPNANGRRISYYSFGFELATALGHADASRWRERYWFAYSRAPSARNAPSHMTDWPRYR